MWADAWLPVTDTGGPQVVCVDNQAQLAVVLAQFRTHNMSTSVARAGSLCFDGCLYAGCCGWTG